MRRKQRVLLAALLLNPNRQVPTERIIDWLWDGGPPASAAQNLYNHISDLRRRLDEPDRDGVRIQNQSGCYRLRVGPGELDVDAFEDLVTQGRRAVDEGDHGLAVERFTRALGLWRGDSVLEGLVLPEPLRIECARLEQLRAGTVEAAFDARLAVGQHRELLPELEAATSRYPLRERLWEQRMLALYRAGRQGDALAVYRRAHDVLGDELGVDPGPDLLRLHRQILSGDSDIAAPPARRSRFSPPAQLPADLSTFTGRDAELARLRALSATSNDISPAAVIICAIDGMAGTGKTALAVHAAHQLVGHYPDGQVFLDLHGFTQGVEPVGPADALERMLRSLGVRGDEIPPTVDERAALWRTHLASRRMLVVLDNAADERQIHPLFPGGPGCLVLITSRHRFLGLDDVHAVSLDVLPLQDAITLFTRIIGSDGMAGQPTESIIDVVELCGRLPLAIRLAAARLRARPAWTLTDLADRLRDQQRRLSALQAGHRSVAAAIDMSCSHLTAEQGRMLDLLGLHPGADVNVHAAAALVDADPDEAERVLDELLDAHLLQQYQRGRYRFHDLVRAHAAERCSTGRSESEQHAALDRLRDHYAYTATAAIGLVYPQDTERTAVTLTTVLPFTRAAQAMAWLDTELSNLIATATHAAEHGRPAHAVHQSTALYRYLYTRHPGTARSLHSHALTAARRLGDRTAEFHALDGLVKVHMAQGRYERAADDAAQTLDIARQMGSVPLQADALRCLGTVHRLQGKLERATACYNQVKEIAVGSGDRIREANALTGLAYTNIAQQQFATGIDHLKRALDLMSGADDVAGETFILNDLGILYRRQGDYEAANGFLQKALGRAAETGDIFNQCEALQGLGSVYRATGRPDQALASFQRALEMAREFADQVNQARALNGLAQVHRDTGQRVQAKEYWRQALAILTEFDVPRTTDIGITQIRTHLAELE